MMRKVETLNQKAVKFNVVESEASFIKLYRYNNKSLFTLKIKTEWTVTGSLSTTSHETQNTKQYLNVMPYIHYPQK